MFRCHSCGAIIHETDMTRSQQREAQCPVCGATDLFAVRDYESEGYMSATYCPMKMSNPNLTPEQWKCEGQACAWWSPYFQMCSTAVPSYLNRREEQRVERREEKCKQ